MGSILRWLHFFLRIRLFQLCSNKWFLHFFLQLVTSLLEVTAWKVSKYSVISAPYFPVFGLNTEIYQVNVRIQSEYRKIRTRNNSVFGHFSRSEYSTFFFVILSKPSSCTVWLSFMLSCFDWSFNVLLFLSKLIITCSISLLFIIVAIDLESTKMVEGQLFYFTYSYCIWMIVLLYYLYGGVCVKRILLISISIEWNIWFPVKWVEMSCVRSPFWWIGNVVSILMHLFGLFKLAGF